MANLSTSNHSNSGLIVQEKQILGWIIATLLTNGFGVFANTVLLIALIIYKPLRQSSSCPMIIHSIVIDLLATTIAVPLDTLPVYLGPAWPLPKTYCKYQALYVYVIYCASMWSSAILALHRLAATVMPHQFRQMALHPRSMIILVILPWLVSFTVNIFPTAGVGIHILTDTVHGGCYYSLVPGNRIWKPFMMYAIFSYYVPSVLMGLSYTVVLVKTTANVQRHGGDTASVGLKRRLEISRTLFMSFLWNCVTVYPINIVVVVAAKTYATNLPLQLGLRWLSTSFGAMNPIFYYGSSTLFQDGIKEVLKCRWWHNRNHRKISGDLGTNSGTAHDHSGQRSSFAIRYIHYHKH